MTSASIALQTAVARFYKGKYAIHEQPEGDHAQQDITMWLFG